ncbi:hypothetical protein COLO4_04509 [Corchorus olitorius]|uniref:Uncharacterized protein n=1 Tax=Corchorus olitorius TaxID=93759 RepID=A0A1R3KTS7_9ROSI|nr:hypothetical protein COLO4_04509 [Corchorus olitorius]
MAKYGPSAVLAKVNTLNAKLPSFSVIFFFRHLGNPSSLLFDFLFCAASETLALFATSNRCALPSKVLQAMQAISIDEEEARVLEQNEEEANDFVAVNVDDDSDGGGIGADIELVCSRNIVQKSLEAEERMRKMLEELEMEDFFEVVPVQQQRQKKKKKVTAGGLSGSENLGGASGAENLGGPRVSDNVGGPRVAENVGGGASGGGNNAYGPNQNVEADKEGEESSYLPSDEPNSFIKTDSEDSEADDAQRCISSGLHISGLMDLYRSSLKIRFSLGQLNSKQH